MNAELLLEAIREIEDRTGASLFVDCVDRATEAPFVIERGARNAVEKAARSLGFRLQERDGFLHLEQKRGMMAVGLH